MHTNNDLRNFFIVANARFFDNRIDPSYTIAFKRMRNDGEHIPTTKTILINSDFKKHGDMAFIVVLHEMAHADLHGYIGYEDKTGRGNGHGMRYQAKLDELYKLGAYDGLL